MVILLLDASSEIADQDAHIAGFVLESGRAMVVAVNKWDGLDSYQRERITHEIERKLHFLRWARFHQVSALKRTGLKADDAFGDRGLSRRFRTIADAQAHART